MDFLACHEEVACASSPCASSGASFEFTTVAADDTADILDTLYRRESGSRSRPAADYLVRTQLHGMTSSWRAQVVDWMMSVAHTVEFEVTTVALAIHYLDMYLSVVSVRQTDLELIALVCLMTASKFNDTDGLTVAEVSHMIDDKYSAASVLAVERSLLLKLQWRLHAALPHHFIECFVAQLPQPDVAADVMSRCATMLAAVVRDITSLDFAPSEIAYTVLTLAMHELHVGASLPTYQGDSPRLVECEEVVEAIVGPSLKGGNDGTVSKRSKRASSPSNVEDFIDDNVDAPPRQRQRLGSV
ncbi:hypothetical protein H257_08621 [Aphanomyces astaci]|uniref:Cyclin-like domain-containing protein n=1 Tax=Aphanomyces astaci TaxID=112090 RepID=W4GDK8_APHAT|nr:hypothetical protein H257_08621 [Aphanomyces astaci]ETV77777.1 hypothetical protein H257_08621 [Aphanomyces astaci]RQM27531.1 hypothetical protein B5M09_008072 [Aphanomyces astaci]|eukprot:XP_009832887.1 hypothetical protein H257_08621 [Aphanomyces astaci]